MDNPKRCALCGSLNPDVYDAQTGQMVCMVCIKEDNPDIEYVDPGDIWVLEYSETHFERGLYPLHVRPATPSPGPGDGNWKIIAYGSNAGINRLCQKKHNELFGSSE